jgi:hypothetical protein
MTKKGIRLNTTLIILGILFLLVVLGGRFIFNNTLPVDDRESNSLVSQTATSSTSTSEQPQTAQTTNRDVATSTPKPLSCSDTIKKDLAQKKQTYVKGQLLVTFAKEVEYKKAKDVLSVYGLVVQNEIESQASYKSRHLITAAVAPGQEITKVCQLRNDSHVKYAGLDVYFGLHE